MKDEKRFYVYVHKRADTGEVFYVGKGSNARYRLASNRSKDWKKLVKKAGGFEYEILHDNLTEDEAFNLETICLSRYTNLINKKLTNDKTKEIDSELISNLIYCENSPSCLKRLTKNGKYVNCGTINGGGYWQVTINKKIYLCHRIVWFMFNKNISKNMVIDHINSQRSDNRIDNLQEISKSENQQKRTRLRENQTWASSGFKNLSISSDKKNITVHWKDSDGLYKYKVFYVGKKKTFDEVFEKALNYRNSVLNY